MTASAVFILDVKGKVIISRNYRGDVPMNCVERFSGHVLEADEADERPVWLEHGTTYIYIKYNNLYIMAVTQRNSNAAMILLFLYRLVEVLKDYFRELEEESIRDNFVITYELMDEMMDFGYPQISEAKILREYITQVRRRPRRRACRRRPPAPPAADVRRCDAADTATAQTRACRQPLILASAPPPRVLSHVRFDPAVCLDRRRRTSWRWSSRRWR